jgi:hypothetical protein
VRCYVLRPFLLVLKEVFVTLAFVLVFLAVDHSVFVQVKESLLLVNQEQQGQVAQL